MRIGITGGTGFLGGHLARRLVSRGDEVVVYTRRPRRRSPTGVSDVKWDAVREPLPPASLEGMEAVVHLAGESVFGRWTTDKKQRIRESRLKSTRNVVLGLKEAPGGPRVFLCGSAVGIYGSRGDEELTEDSKPGRGFLADLAKEWEAAGKPAEALGLRVVYLRTSIPLDASGGFLKTVLPIFNLGLGGRLGNGRQWFPWAHLADWLDLTVFALDRASVEGPLNATGPNPVTNRMLTQTLGKVLGRPTILPVPAFALKLLPGNFAEETALVSQRVIPAKAMSLGFAFRRPSLEGTLRDLLKASA